MFSPKQQPCKPIAIVAIAGRFPGANSPEELWQRIISKRPAAHSVAPERWVALVEELLKRNGTPEPDKAYCEKLCSLDSSATEPQGLPVDTMLAESLDPLYRLVLRVGSEAWKAAKTKALDKSRTGVVLAAIALPTDSSSALTRETIGKQLEKTFGTPDDSAHSVLHSQTAPVNSRVVGYPARLLSDTLGLGKTAYTLDAACASSLYALRQGCDLLNEHKLDAVLAGGVSRPDCLYTQMGFCQLKALTPTGICAPFDEQANGLIVGEGCGFTVLKRLSDAMRDGDEIHGVIRSVGISCDIDGSLLSPASEGQLRAMRQAYALAGLTPADIDYIECHGTGTPVGDAEEIKSYTTLWNEYGIPATDDNHKCVVASVKATVGHMLTAAGMGGLTAVLQAVKNHTLPPTSSFTTPAKRCHFDAAPVRVLTQGVQWNTPAADKPRRAAVSAFGFGGINAHLILEEFVPSYHAQAVATTAQPHAPIAIIGIAARVGKATSIREFQAAMFRGNGKSIAGAIAKLSIPPTRYRIPPKEMEGILPQQLLMLETAREALLNADQPQRARRPMASVFVGQSLDPNTNNYQLRWAMPTIARELNITDSNTIDEMRDSICPPLDSGRVLGSLGNIIANRIAKEFQFGGNSFAVSAEEDSGIVALQLACDGLARHDIDLAIAGCVDMVCDNRLMRTSDGKPTDAAVAFVLKRLDDAVNDNNRILAIIDDDCATPVSYAEFLRNSRNTTLPETSDNCAVERMSDLWCGAATNAVAFAKTVCALYQHIVPAHSEPFNYDAASELYYSPAVPHYWYRNRRNGSRYAVVMGADKTWHLREAEQSSNANATIRKERTNPMMISATVFAVGGNSENELISLLQELFNKQPGTKSLPVFAKEWNKLHPLAPEMKLATCIIADTFKTLHSRISFALKAIKEKQTVHGEKGVYYTPTPCASENAVCFVYPGSGSHYPAMGIDAGTISPAVLDDIDASCRRFKDQLRPDLLMPYHDWSPEKTRQQLDENAIALLTSHVAHAGVMTALLRTLGIEPHYCLSYSLGESSSYFALRAWHERDEMLERMERSTLFTKDLYGHFDAIRKEWKIDDSKSVSWTVALCGKSAKAIRPLIEKYPHIYLLIVNAPEECVLGGEREQLEQLSQDMQTPMLYLDGVTVAHCPIVNHVREPYRALHYFEETSQPQNIAFYSSALGKQIPLTPDNCADSITAHALHGFDFNAITRLVHHDGARAFVEVGPGNSCTRMINKILGNKDKYCAASACRPNENAVSSILDVVAMLISERALNNLQPLYSCFVSTVDEPESIDTIPPVVVTCHPVFEFHKLTPPVAAPTEPKQIATTAPTPSAPVATATTNLTEVALQALCEMAETQNRLHQQFLDLSAGSAQLLAFAKQLEELCPVVPQTMQPEAPTAMFPYAACMEFAIGKIGNVLGPDFAEIDSHPTRVRLPDQPLMLCHRILSVEGTPKSLTSGRCVTEHDVVPNAWYLDGGVAPVCISVEAGQADLFLCSYLGIDFKTKGKRVYRLLDATIHFHRGLPQPGETMRYDIRIDRFVQQGDTWLFFFHYDGTINGEPFLTMRDGCAGFFTHEEVRNSGGVILKDAEQMPPALTMWQSPIPVRAEEHYSEQQIDALRVGNLAACFGDAFASIPYRGTPFLPSGKMRLVHRVTHLNTNGGRYNRGLIRAEADIHPDDWFLTCHFVDDMVMPGTLMYECCAHTLRIYLLRIGLIADPAHVRYEPIPMHPAKLLCRGPVLQSTKIVTYEIHIMELGFNPQPFVIVEAIMYADGQRIVRFDKMSMQITGSDRSAIEMMWEQALGKRKDYHARRSYNLIGDTQLTQGKSEATPLFDYQSILTYSAGNPSDAFGELYKRFDIGNKEGRVLARLPRPPYLVMSRVTQIHDGKQWEPAPGLWIESQYDFSPQDWYFRANNRTMPFCVILEVALQPCGWICAYLGCALKSEMDLKFRNLSGKATLFREVTMADAPQTLTMRTKLTKLNEAGGMIIMDFDTQIWLGSDIIYDCVTEFGFFSAESLTNQVGIRGAEKRRFVPLDADIAKQELPILAPLTPADNTSSRPAQMDYPGKAVLMLDRITHCASTGGPKGFGYVRGEKTIDPDEWLFYAHFYQDPVCPGSLGVESFIQLIKHYMIVTFPELAATHRFEPIATNIQHEWVYRGQIIQSNKTVTIDAVITNVVRENNTITVFADGFLDKDNIIIYEMKNFALRAIPKGDNL